MQPTETDAIVLRVLRGDVDAYGELVRHHQEAVWRVVAAMLLNTQQTEELVHRAFLQAYQHLHRFRAGGDFAAWIKAIARNTVRQEIRQRSRTERKLTAYYNHWLAHAEMDAESEDRRPAALEECARKLPPSSAELVALRYERGLDFAAIAVALGRTVEATRQHLSRIRAALRDCIEKELARP